MFIGPPLKFHDERGILAVGEETHSCEAPG
jgi:hypothetical protein